MQNAKPTKELFDAVKAHYTETSRRTSTVGRMLTVLQKNPDQEIVKSLLDWCSEITSRESLSHVLGNLNGIILKVEDKEVEASLKEVASQVKLFMDALPFESEDLKFLLSDQVNDYLFSLDTSVQKALSFLAVRAGLTPSDILREVNGLNQVKEGRVEIGPKTSKAMPRGRVVTFDPTLLNEELDPSGEIMEIIANYNVRADTVGLDGLALIGAHTNRLPYTMTQLRTSHAIHLLQDGMSWDGVAALQGVNKLSLRNRVDKYLAANQITL